MAVPPSPSCTIAATAFVTPVGLPVAEIKGRSLFASAPLKVIV